MSRPPGRRPQAGLPVPQTGRRSLAGILLLALVSLAFLAVPPARAEKKKEKQKGNNGVFSAGGVLKGNYHHLRFIIPFRGDFSRYNKVEIVQVASDVGSDTVPPEKLEKYTEWLQQLFADTGLFEEVLIVEEMALGPTPAAPASPTPGKELERPSAMPRTDLVLLASLVPEEEFTGIAPEEAMVAIQVPGHPVSPALPVSADPEKEFTGISPQDALVVIQTPGQSGSATPDEESSAIPPAEAAVPHPSTPPPDEKHTLVVTSTVMDYLKGSRAKRMLGVGIGGSRFTVRFSIRDKQTGQEVARGNVTGAVEDTSFGLPGGSGSDQSLKVAAGDLVHHVERRVRNADR
ncbi:MAG: hypothetical protein ACE5HL_12810 [Terriglobia bacterium]